LTDIRSGRRRNYRFFLLFGTKVRVPGCRLKETGGHETMGAALQIANASVAAIFSVALFLTAQLFTEYRSTHAPAVTFAERLFVPL
jgi:hypothetical protein